MRSPHELPAGAPMAHSDPPAPLAAEPVAWAMTAAVVAGLLGTAYTVLSTSPAWHLRAAVLLVTAAVGVPLVVRALRTDLRPAAIAALAFLATATFSTVLSANPVLSLVGRYGGGGGLLFAAGLVGAWAIGAWAGRPTWVRNALLAAVLVNAVFAVGQILFDPSLQVIGLYRGRAHGLMGNPVHLAALLTGGLMLVVATRTKHWAWVLAAAAIAFALQTSGTRFALLLIPVVAVVALWAHRWRRGLVYVAVIALAGVGGSALVTGLGGAAPTERIASTSSGITERTEVWRMGLAAYLEEPVFGHGPGLFLDAATPHITDTLATIRPGEQLFADAHNLAVEYAVTTGSLGLLALGAFMALIVGRARGPLLGFALVVLAFHAIQPQSAGTTPLVFLALGAAGTTRRRPAALGIPTRSLIAVGVTLAVAAGGLMVFGDHHLREGGLEFDSAAARIARRTLGAWPQPHDLSARIQLFEAVTTDDPRAGELARHWYRRAAAADPGNPARWNRLADAEVATGRPHDAVTHYLVALERDPWSAHAMLALGELALLEGDVKTAAAYAAKAGIVSESPRVPELLEAATAASSSPPASDS